jgi:hypothetical protein
VSAKTVRNAQVGGGVVAGVVAGAATLAAIRLNPVQSIVTLAKQARKPH